MASNVRQLPQRFDREVDRALDDSLREINEATEQAQRELDGVADLAIALSRRASGMSRRLDALPVSELEPPDLAAVRSEISALDAAATKTISRLHFADDLHRRLLSIQRHLTKLAHLIQPSA